MRQKTGETHLQTTPTVYCFLILSALCQAQRMFLHLLLQKQIKPLCQLAQMQTLSQKQMEKALFGAKTKPIPRWGNRSKSIVYSYSPQKKQKIVRYKKLKAQLFQPALSTSGKIVAIQKDKNFRTGLVFLFKNSIEPILKPQKNKTFQEPIFDETEEKIFFFSLDQQGSGEISVFFLKTGKKKRLLSLGNSFFSGLLAKGDFLFFNWGVSGITEVYAFHIPTGDVFQVTQSRYGARDACPKGDSLLYSEYTINGYRVVAIKNSPEEWQKKNTISATNYPIADFLIKTEKSYDVDTVPVSKKHSVLPYNRFENSFHFYGWMPFYTPLKTFSEIHPGIRFLSQSLLDDFQYDISGYYNLNNNKVESKESITYSGFYPKIKLSHSFYYGNTFNNGKHIPENVFRVETFVPLLFLRRNKFFSFSPIIGYESIVSKEYLIGNPTSNKNIVRNYLHVGFSKSFGRIKNKKKALSDVSFQTKAGYLRSVFRNFKVDKPHTGVYADFSLSVPSPIHKNHGIRTYARAFQQSDLLVVGLSAPFSLLKDEKRTEFKHYSFYGVLYELPIAFPDASILNSIYIKRIDLYPFFEQTIEKKSFVQLPLTTEIRNFLEENTTVIGADLRIKVHFLNIVVPNNIIIRTLYSLPENKFSWYYSANFTFSF